MAKIALFKAGNSEAASGPKASVVVANDGRVTFLAIGAGTGRWRAHFAFAEVLDGVVLRRWDAFVTDANPIASVLLDSNNGQLAGWLVEGEGAFAVGGFADAAEGAAAIAMHDFGQFAADADRDALPTSFLAVGTTATVGTVQYVWNGSAWEVSGGSVAFPSSLNQIAAHRQYAGYSSGGNSLVVAADSTVCRKHSVPFKFYNFTVFLENHGSSPITYDAIFVRVGGNGNTQNTSVQLTYQGSTTITVPAATSSNKYTIPGVVECDPIIDYNLDPTYVNVVTSGTPIPVWIRAHTTTGGTFCNGQDLTSFAAIQDAALSVAGDQASTWSTQTLQSTGPIFSSLRLRTKIPTCNVLFIGDSLTQLPWGETACAAANAARSDRQFVWFKSAVGGVNSNTFLGWAKTWIPLIKPDYVYVPSFTPNDGSNVFELGKVHQSVMEIIALAKANGAKVITSTPFPDDGFTNSRFLLRVVPLANEVLASSDLVLDWYGLMNDPDRPGYYKAGYTTDGVHPNAAGQAIIQPVANDFFVNLLGKI